jgi:twitching motility protein PilT
LITGPTRHAKSTTAASIIDHIRQHNQTGGHLATIEDPIEYVFGETNRFVVTQREIGVHYVDYAQAARETMRIAPTIVFLHEILNASAAQAALQLGTTGHLTIATMQADTVEGAVSKFLTFLEDDTQRSAFLQNLRGVVRTCLMPNAAKDNVPAGSQFIFASEVLDATLIPSLDDRRTTLLGGSPLANLKQQPSAYGRSPRRWHLQ